MKRKLAAFGLAFSLAQLAAAYLPPLAIWLAAFFVLVGIAAVFLRTRRAGDATLLLAAVCLGLGIHMGYDAAVVRPIRSLAGKTVQITATVETDAETSYREDSLCGTLHLSSIDGEPADIQVYCGNFPGTRPGEMFTATVRLESLENNSYRLHHYSEGVFLSAEYLSGYRFVGESRSLPFLLYRLRQELSARLTRFLPAGEGGVEAAMLVGDTARLSGEMEDNFRAAGVSHLLAVSGLHVMLLCGLFAAANDHRRKFSRPRILAQAAVLLLYLALIGFPVSAVRAGLVYLVALGGYFFLQPPDTLTSMGLVAVILGISNAYFPCDLGFQLSFSAVLGVQLAAALSRRERDRFPEPEHPLASRARNMLFALVDAVQLSVFAGLATMPVLLANGLTVSGVGVLTNLLVVWMLKPAMLLGIGVLLGSLAPVLEFLQRGFSLALTVWLRILCGIVTRCAELPGARLALPTAYTLLVLAVLGGLAYLFWRSRRMHWYPLAGAVCTAAAVGLGIWLSADVVRIAVVGTAGNPCLVVTRNHAAAVLFRGGASNWQDVQEYLLNSGDPPIETLVDLRQQPSRMAFSADAVLTMEQMKAGVQSIAVLDGITLDLMHDSGGNLAVLDINGYTVGIMAGRADLEQPLELNVYCAGGSYPDLLDAHTVIYTSREADWLGKVRSTRLLYGPEEPLITIRPGCSATLKGVQSNAVQ